MFFACAQGFRKCSDGLGGHPSITDDGNGNVQIAADKQIQFLGSNTASTPHLVGTDLDSGIRLTSTIQQFIRNGSVAWQQQNGDLVIESGNQLLFGGDNTGSTPHMAREADPDTGVRIESGVVSTYVNGSQRVRWTNSHTTWTGPQTRIPSATQSITAATDKLALLDTAHLKVSSDAAYTMTGLVSTGQDGQECKVENIGAFNITIQDSAINILTDGGTDIILGPDDAVSFVYSTDAAAWIQIGPHASIN